MKAPRFLIAAAHKSSGKTVVSTGLAAALTARGIKLAAFKKGPDYIDPMWLGAAIDGPCYNLDFNTQTPDEIARFAATRMEGAELTLIEANKGLFDGLSMDGSDSNAAVARLLKLPVILVIDTNGTTRGIAPLLMGYRAFDPEVNIAGVILNKVGGTRHEAKLRQAVQTYVGLPVLGAVYKSAALEIGERHLGLTTPAETGELKALIGKLGEIVGGSVDLDALVAIAATAPDLPDPPARVPTPEPDVTIAIARDRAFGFYYPDDLEAFAAHGARLVPFDTMRDKALPEADGLFIGGGFPEMFVPELAANAALRADIAAKIGAGLPTYAECGGLMYLTRSIVAETAAGEMVGVVPAEAVMHPRPQGRGYTRFRDTNRHPWPGAGGETKAHEFHYARLEALDGASEYGRAITRGHGVDGESDGVVLGNTLAGFCHLRATEADDWVARFVTFVRAKKGARSAG